MFGRASNRDLLDALKRGRTTLEEKAVGLRTQLQDVVGQFQVLFQLEQLISQDRKLAESAQEDITTELTSIKSIKEGIHNELKAAVASPTLSLANGVEPQSVLNDSVGDKDVENSKELANQKQIALLKASRDKLLFELDRLSVELECSHATQEQLETQAQEHHLLSTYWKQQTKDSNKKVEQLKDMLDETVETCQAQNLPETDTLSAAAKSIEKEQKLQDLGQRLIESEFKNKALRESWLPALKKLESRLMELNSAVTNAVD